MKDNFKISIDKDISVAQTIPSYFYKSDYIFNKTIENIFNNSWQFVVNKNSLKHKLYPFLFIEGLIDDSYVMVNGDQLKILSNVCTHRAALLCSENSNGSTIKCNYHGRVFNLNGELIKHYGFEGVKNFPSKKDNLIKINHFDWNNFIFCSKSSNINIKKIFDDINTRLSGYKFQDLEYNKDESNTYIVDFHWALYCENYLEGFHVPFIHKGLNDDIDYSNYETIILDNAVLQLAKDKNNEIYAHYYWIFPNIMLNFYDWGLSINIITPLTKNKTKINFLSFPKKGMVQPKDTPSGIDIVEKEDQEIVKSLQIGIKSSNYTSGRYSVKHEKGIHYFHLLISEYLK